MSVLSAMVYLASSQNKIPEKQNPVPCFCDSITKIRQTSTLKEYLCYKETSIYKLQVKKTSERISRLNYKEMETEIFEKNLSATLVKTNSLYLEVASDETNYVLNYIGSAVDSLQVVIVNKQKTLFFKYFKGNVATFSKVLGDNPENKITVLRHFSFREDEPATPSMHDEDGECVLGSPGKPFTRRVMFEIVPAMAIKSFVEFPLDRVLIEIKKCINRR